MAIQLTSLPLPASADPSKFVDFGKEVKGVDPGNLTPEQFQEIHDALYKACSSLSVTNSFVIDRSLNSTAPYYSGMSISLLNNNMP